MAQLTTNEEAPTIDKIIEQIGNYGLFQKRYMWSFNFVLIILLSMMGINKYVSLNVPDHWCYVPGRENTNYTIDQWKQLTIPLKHNSTGIQVYSKCARFANLSHDTKYVEFDTKKTISCDQGWEYDRTWYEMTTTMQENWVCDKSMLPTHGLAVIYAGDVFASLVYGQVADNFGRLVIFYISLVIVIVTRIITIYTSSWLYVFMVFTLISAQIDSVIQNAITIGMEISRVDKRAFTSMLVILSMSLGVMIGPLFMWWLRDWVIYSLVTTLPCIIFIFFNPWIIESPRWLVYRGMIKRCIKELKKVADTNKAQLPITTETELTKIYNNQEKNKRNILFGFVSSPRLIKNTLILVFCFTTTRLIIACFIVNISNFKGNPFMNYFYQALCELPSFLVGKYISDRFGRRWVTLFGFTLTFIGSFALFYVIQGDPSVLVINIFTIFIKFNLSITFYSSYLQNLEIYPTCIRQSGISLGLFFSNLMSIPAPYIVVLGVTVNASLPYCIYGTIALLAAICSFFLPETLNQQLPETLQDASTFGADQNWLGKNILQKST